MQELSGFLSKTGENTGSMRVLLYKVLQYFYTKYLSTSI